MKYDRKIVGQNKTSYLVCEESTIGKWHMNIEIPEEEIKVGEKMELKVKIYLSDDILKNLLNRNLNPKSLLLLSTSERYFDSQGILRLPLDEKMSTLLTPTGLAIEGGSVSAISKHVGSRHKNPVDEIFEIPLDEFQKDHSDKFFWVERTLKLLLPEDMPPGIYRIRLDLGITDEKKKLSLNLEEFGGRPQNEKFVSLAFSPPFSLSGLNVHGNWVNANEVEKKLYWILLNDYNSNGYQGVIANEDKQHFALSGRNIVPDEVILPLYDNRGNQNSYNLEPVFAADLVDKQRNIPWNYSSGQLSIKVVNPDGTENDLGYAPFIKSKDGCATTGETRFTEWKPKAYGKYKVTVKGWIEDIWGNCYFGGGTYEFWIAKRMTFGSPIFMGMPFSVGLSYGAEIGFAPAVPADVIIKADLYVDSDPEKIKTVISEGKANSGGMFNAAYGLKELVYDKPGEYHASLRATYTDDEGHLWVCALRHVGIVYRGKGQITAHGKKFESRTDQINTYSFPYNYGEVLLIPRDNQGINKIESVLTYEYSNSENTTDCSEYDFQKIGSTNVRILTSNGLCPHIYPEYITDWAYYYAAAARPGLSASFLVAEDGVHNPCWSISATNFGGQIAASNNGSIAGTPSRLIGGIVLRKKDEAPIYADYIANAFVAPEGSEAKVIKAGEEDLTGAKGEKFRYFIISHRPGLLYEQGQMFRPYLQMDPIVPARVKYTVTYPDGSEKMIEGKVDTKRGYLASIEAFEFDQAGAYRINFESNWEGHKGSMPGMPQEGAYIFVYEKDTPKNISKLKLNLKKQQSFNIDEGLVIEGVSSAKKVYYASITPGALVDQGVIPVENGCFKYHFSPDVANSRVPIYDTKNIITGRKETGRVIHLTFFAPEEGEGGKTWHSYTRVIIRGTTAFYT